LADICIVTSDNSRSELPEDIIGEILGGFDTQTAHAVIPSRREAIRYAVEQARGGDVVLLCGKGHEKYEIGPYGRRDFDEAGIAEETALRIARSKAQTKEDNENEG
jgi:UDP-N-acetylmuramyl tripeptide synthase